MNAPHKPTFKLSLLDCFVIMITFSVLLSIDVFAYKNEWSGALNDWYRSSSALDGLMLMLLLHITVVIVTVITVRMIRTLYRKEIVRPESPESPMPNPNAEVEIVMRSRAGPVSESQKAGGCIAGVVLNFMGAIAALGALGQLIAHRPLEPERFTFCVILTFLGIGLGNYVLRITRQPPARKKKAEEAPVYEVRPNAEPVAISGWFIVVCALLLLVWIFLTVFNSSRY